MPLTPTERQRIVNALDGITAGDVPGDHLSSLDRFSDALNNIAKVFGPFMEKAAAGAMSAAEELTGEQTGPATDTPRRRGRKPQAGGGDGVAATAQQPGATAPTAPPPQSVQSVAQPAPAGNSPDLGGFGADDGTDPFGEKVNGVDPLEIPENLRRAPAQAAPAPQPTVQEVRDLIKKYMDKHGIPAANDMLFKIAKTKKFAEIDASKWGEIAATCRAGLQ